MKVAEKYKQTEVGLTPSDWDIFLLDELATKIGSGITPTGGSTVYKEDGRPFIRSQNIGWGNLLLDDIAFIDDETHQTFPNTEIKINDVFLNISGASIGRSSFANEKLVGGNVNQHVCIIRVIDKKLNPNYLNLFLLSKNGQKQIDSFQSGGNRQGLNIGQIKTFQIPIPPTIEEQTAIATALSDADALISSLEKLIAKKRMIKQGAMQQLLQPKEGWEVKTIGEVFTFYSTSNFSKAEMTLDGEVGCVHYGLIHALDNTSFSIESNVKYYVTREQAKYEPLQNGDIVMVDASEDLVSLNKSVEVSGIDQKVFIAGLHTFHLRDKNLTYIDSFRGLVLNSEAVKKQMLRVAVGMKVFGVSKPQLKEISIPIPTKSEQTRIATILSDMDAEIAALETKLEKYRKVKLGMMQNLLTGKIRLV